MSSINNPVHLLQLTVEAQWYWSVRMGSRDLHYGSPEEAICSSSSLVWRMVSFHTDSWTLHSGLRGERSVPKVILCGQPTTEITLIIRSYRKSVLKCQKCLKCQISKSIKRHLALEMDAPPGCTMGWSDSYECVTQCSLCTSVSGCF